MMRSHAYLFVAFLAIAGVVDVTPSSAKALPTANTFIRLAPLNHSPKTHENHTLVQKSSNGTSTETETEKNLKRSIILVETSGVINNLTDLLTKYGWDNLRALKTLQDAMYEAAEFYWEGVSDDEMVRFQATMYRAALVHLQRMTEKKEVPAEEMATVQAEIDAAEAFSAIESPTEEQINEYLDRF